MKQTDRISKPHAIYAEVLEDTALDQFVSAMEQDYAIKGALMADAHTGYGLPIGGVVETEGVIVPSWVGYDIGCGMLALPTPYSGGEIRGYAKRIFEAIYQHVPTGFATHQHAPEGATELRWEELSEIGREAFRARGGFRHLGTLGGGNHFIEIGEDEGQRAWVVIHSGSRGVGWKIAQEYMKIAGGGKAQEGHFPLRLDSEYGLMYVNDMTWATQFALDNRMQIARQVLGALRSVTGSRLDAPLLHGVINRNHNHAELTGRGTWIHRKGATHAEKDMMGVIPGNMRDGSFIVVGLGNEDSLQSSSHGAGRVLGRKRAQRELSLDGFHDTMQGITAKVGEDTLDESPFAYKDIFQVMALQHDLVNIFSHITPIINVKA